MDKWKEWERRLTVAVLILIALILCYKLSEAGTSGSASEVNVREMANDVKWLKTWIQRGSSTESK